MSSFVCPHCGAVVPANSRACPECGSDRETGWSDEYHADLLPPEDESEARPPHHLARRVARYVGVAVASLLVAGLLSLGWPPYGFYLGSAIVVASIVASILFRERPATHRNTEKQLEQELLRLCGNDPQLADRLVVFEGTLRPGAARSVLLRNARDRLLRDRSR